MDLKFRTLRADEIDCRVAQVKQNGLSLLLYKDARCDMNILDETVGPMNWQRKHGRENANCIVSIWDDDKKQWIEKEDTGTESNTEAEKGLASDSFKRACFNWGLGRELYTAPFIWVSNSNCEIKQGGNGKFACYDKFEVMDIKYTDGRISDLSIWNTTKNCMAYQMKKAPAKRQSAAKNDPVQSAGGTEYYICEVCGNPNYPFTKKDGTIMQVRDMLALGQRDYGKTLCRDCYERMFRESKNK